MNIIEAWAEGREAPYDLFDVDGKPVEQVGDDRAPRIARGSTVTKDVADWVSNAVEPPEGEPVECDTWMRDEDGNLLWEKGEPVIVTVTVTPRPNAVTLTEPPDDTVDSCCDLCGNEREELFGIGRGEYCKVEWLPNGAVEETTCYDLRLTQLEASAQ